MTKRDIVERLRGAWRQDTFGGEPIVTKEPFQFEWLHEAADEIERLRKEIVELKLEKIVLMVNNALERNVVGKIPRPSAECKHELVGALDGSCRLCGKDLP